MGQTIPLEKKYYNDKLLVDRQKNDIKSDR